MMLLGSANHPSTMLRMVPLPMAGPWGGTGVTPLPLRG